MPDESPYPDVWGQDRPLGSVAKEASRLATACVLYVRPDEPSHRSASDLVIQAHRVQETLRREGAARSTSHREEPRAGPSLRARIASLVSLAIVCLAAGVVLGSLAALLAFAVLALRP